MIWKVLGIEKTKNKDEIKQAYRTRLKSVNPEDDQEGFKELRSAYEEAIIYADTPEKDNEQDADETSNEKKTEVDLWLDKVLIMYEDMALRRDVSKWKALLSDSVCDDLDTEIEAGEKLLVFLMSHSYIPQKVWQLIDKKFDYSGSVSILKERFPENYIDYVIWQINNTGFLDYDLFDGDTKDHVDDFINKIYEIKNAEDNKDLEKANQVLKELRRFDLTHPYVDVEEANCLLLKAGNLKELTKDEITDIENADEYRREALDIMERLDFEYSSNLYIHRIYGESLLANKKVDAAAKVFDEIGELENGMANFSAMLGKAKCLIIEEKYEDAKEQIEDILEDKVQDFESLALLDVVNKALVKSYVAILEKNTDKEVLIKLGWCYYQQREFEKGIKLLDTLDEGSDYDYVNLRCRLYLANDDYEKAYPWAVKWLSMIEESEDDGSREMSKRKNRLSLANFSIGICLWELNDGQRDDAVDYINKAVSQESNRLVKLSYMEQLAKFYLAEGEHEKCIDVCSDIIEIDHGFFPAYVHRQRANYELKNAREVIDDYYICIELYKEYAPPYVLAAEVFFAFEQYEDIEEILKNTKEANIESDALDLYRIRVVHYKDFSKENIKKCVKMMDELLEKISKRSDDNPTDIEKEEELIREHALIYWDLDENDRAIQIINDYLKDHDSFSLQNLKVDIFNQAGRSKEALRLCDELYKKNPTAYMQTRLGICYEKLKDYKNALLSYKGAYEKDPKYHIVVRRLMFLYSYLSNAEHDLDKCRKGIRFATEYIDLTDSSEGYMERGNLYIDLYKLEEAVSDCKKAIELDENAYYAYNNLGCALLKLRRIDEAIPPLVHAINMDEKKDHLPYLNLAECYMIKGEYAKAVDEYNVMMDRFDDLTRYKDEVAKLYCRMEEYNKAISLYEEMIKEQCSQNVRFNIIHKIKDDNSSATHYERLLELYCGLADVYRQAGDNEQCVIWYGKVLNWWKKVLRPDVSVNTLIKIAEYYRDEGRLSDALKMIEYTWKKMSPTELHSRVRRNYDFAAMSIYYELDDKRKAYIKSNIYMEEVTGSLGSLDKLLNDERYRSMWLFNIGIAKLCAGELKDAESYFEQIRQCKLCVMCESCDCFEYYFAMGLVAETKKDYKKAVKMYEKAIELRKDYPAAKRHLNLVKDKI